MKVFWKTKPRPALGVCFGPGGRTLAAGGSGGFDVWDLASGSRRFIPTPDSTTLYAFVFDPLGRWLYFSENRRGCHLYDPTSGAAPRLPGHPHDQHVISLAATPKGSRLAVSRGGYGRNRLECWAIASDGAWTLAWSVPSATERVSFRGLSFHPAGHAVASVEERPGRSITGTAMPIVLRDARSGEQRAEFGALPNTLYVRATFTPGGEQLITRDPEQFSVWDVAVGKRLAQVPRPGRANFNGLAVHPSGKFFVTVGGDGQVRFWDAETLRQTQSLCWDVGKLHSVAFSPDGMLAAAGGDKGQVVVWDVDA